MCLRGCGHVNAGACSGWRIWTPWSWSRRHLWIMSGQGSYLLSHLSSPPETILSNKANTAVDVLNWTDDADSQDHVHSDTVTTYDYINFKTVKCKGKHFILELIKCGCLTHHNRMLQPNTAALWFKALLPTAAAEHIGQVSVNCS